MTEGLSNPDADRESAEALELVTSLLADELPRYGDCPEVLNLERNRLGRILTDFRRTSDGKLIELMKKVKSSPELDNMDQGERRLAIDVFWWMEYYQSIYLTDRNWFVTDVRQGDIGSSSAIFKRAGDPRNDKRKVFIHSHPADQTFSSSDLHLLFLAINAEKILGYEINIVPPSISLLFAVADHHTFMCFPTQETVVPGFADGMANGLISSEFMEELLPDRFKKTWESLIILYGREKLSAFIGNRLFPFDPIFPEEVNDLGNCIIELAHTLAICHKYHLPLYSADKNNTIFRRINSVEDIYPELKTI